MAAVNSSVILRRGLIFFVICTVASVAIYFYCGSKLRWVSEHVSPFATRGPGSFFGTSEADQGNFILSNYAQFQTYSLISTIICLVFAMLFGLLLRDQIRKQSPKPNPLSAAPPAES